MTTEDLFPLYHVPSDSEVMEYLEPPFSMEAAKQFLYKAGICETPLLWAVAVSYTHLDVYKRQVYGISVQPE